MMEQSNDTAETSSRGGSKKHRGSKNEQEDRISSLPDSILLHILSFLPMKDAVKTVLLRRFGNLWASVQTLDFDGRSYNDFSVARHNKWFTDFMYHVLHLHESPIVFKFSLKFGSFLYFSPKDILPQRHQKPLRREFAGNINSWIGFAVRKKVKVLELGILAHGSSSSRFDYDLPDSVLNSDSLTELKLVNIGLRLQGQIHMRSLKTLSLTTIMLSDTVIERVLHGCPLLESLSIIQCYGLHKLNCTSTFLKNLMVVLGKYELLRLEICGPNIMSIHISGFKGHVDLKNISSLVEATVDLYFDGACPSDEYCNVGMLLEKLHHANIFTIGNWCILADDLLLGRSGMREVNYWNDDMLLRSYDFDEESYWNSLQPFNCLKSHLKTIKISGCVSNPYAIHLVKFLLRFSLVLEKLVISMPNQWSHPFSEELLKFSQMLSSFPKASDSAVILLS